MPESIWKRGRLTAVVSPSGVDEFGKPRYRRARFDILDWASTSAAPRTTYVVPLGINEITGSDVAALDDDELSREFGFYGVDQLVLEPHQGDGKSDTVQALHTFGPV